MLDALVMAITPATSLDVGTALGSGRRFGCGDNYSLLPSGMCHKNCRQSDGSYAHLGQHWCYIEDAGVKPGLGAQTGRR